MSEHHGRVGRAQAGRARPEARRRERRLRDDHRDGDRGRGLARAGDRRAEPGGLRSAVTALVLWIAHVYAHTLAESLERGRRLDLAEFTEVARRELAMPYAAVAPVGTLVLAAVGVLEPQTAVWVALGFGVVTLAVQGVRYAALERLGRTGTAISVALNVALGLVIVGLEAWVVH